MTPASPTLSAVLIVCDEEANLRAQVDVWSWFDEVIVVDGGSRDRTLVVAQEYGARVYERTFDNFAVQRNYALSQARGDYILSLDADERPTPALMREIRQQIARADRAAYRVPIRSTIFGRRFRYSGTQDDRPVRLVRRGTARWRGEVHEVLQGDSRPGQLTNWLEHRTLPNLAAFLGKMHRYTSLEAAARVAAGRAPRSRDRWFAPAVEVVRRLVWKHGWLDGPEGWAFCLLSGLSAHVLAVEHQRNWLASRLEDNANANSQESKRNDLRGLAGKKPRYASKRRISDSRDRAPSELELAEASA